MISFFSIRELNGEALVCTIMFVVSIFYIVLGYKSVHAEIRSDEEKRQFTEMSQNPERLATILNNWR